MTPESVLKKQVLEVLEDLKERDPHWWWYKTSDRFTAGLPDIMGVYRGIGFGLELKALGERPTALQRITLMRIRKAGGVAAWVDNIRDAVLFFTRKVEYEATIREAPGSPGGKQ